jgi:hypothetical protein
MKKSILFLNGFAFSLCYHGKRFPSYRGAMRLCERKDQKYKETKNLKTKERSIKKSPKKERKLRSYAKTKKAHGKRPQS